MYLSHRSNLTDEGERISIIMSGAPLHPLSSKISGLQTILKSGCTTSVISSSLLLAENNRTSKGAKKTSQSFQRRKSENSVENSLSICRCLRDGEGYMLITFTSISSTPSPSSHIR